MDGIVLFGRGLYHKLYNCWLTDKIRLTGRAEHKADEIVVLWAVISARFHGCSLAAWAGAKGKRSSEMGSWSANPTACNNNTKDMSGQFSCMIRSGSTLWCWTKENYAVCRHGQCYGLMGLMVWCHPIGNPCYQHKENFFISGRISWNNMERHGMVWYGISGDQFTQL